MMSEWEKKEPFTMLKIVLEGVGGIKTNDPLSSEALHLSVNEFSLKIWVRWPL